MERLMKQIKRKQARCRTVCDTYYVYLCEKERKMIQMYRYMLAHA